MAEGRYGSMNRSRCNLTKKNERESQMRMHPARRLKRGTAGPNRFSSQAIPLPNYIPLYSSMVHSVACISRVPALASFNLVLLAGNGLRVDYSHYADGISLMKYAEKPGVRNKLFFILCTTNRLFTLKGIDRNYTATHTATPTAYSKDWGTQRTTRPEKKRKENMSEHERTSPGASRISEPFNSWLCYSLPATSIQLEQPD